FRAATSWCDRRPPPPAAGWSGAPRVTDRRRHRPRASSARATRRRRHPPARRPRAHRPLRGPAPSRRCDSTPSPHRPASPSARPSRCRAVPFPENRQSPLQRLRVESTSVFARRVVWVIVCASALSASSAPSAPAQPRVLRWAGDPEGGAPYVEADPSHPDQLVGFDVEIAELFARALGRSTEFVNIRFESIDQSIVRGDADVGMSGIEDTPARRAALAVSMPYYEFREV